MLEEGYAGVEGHRTPNSPYGRDPSIFLKNVKYSFCVGSGTTMDLGDTRPNCNAGTGANYLCILHTF